jgi:hypothetical protein
LRGASASARARTRRDSIFFDHRGNQCATDPDDDRHKPCHGRWAASLSLGFRPDGKRIRRAVTWQTKTVVKDKLRHLRREIERGVKTRATYTSLNAQATGSPRPRGSPSAADREADGYSAGLTRGRLGKARLRDLSALHVLAALTGMTADGRAGRRHQDTAIAPRLRLPRLAHEALCQHQFVQERMRREAGPLWREQGLVFASAVGTPREAGNVRRSVRAVLESVDGIEASEWSPSDMRHIFVSLQSDNGVLIEEIARLLGRESGSVDTERVYRNQLRPVTEEGAVAMDQIFGD